ncbi:unnamed protein product [Penicillium viridicatum]
MGVAFMAQPISGAYFVSAANSMFDTYLLETLARIAPKIDAAKVLYIGVLEVASVYKGEQSTLVREAYMAGIKEAAVKGP